MHDAFRCPRIGDTGRQAIGNTKTAFDLTSASTPPSEESWPPSKRAMMGLPATGDRPGSAGVVSTLAGMGSDIDRVLVLQLNPMADQVFAPCPPTLVNNPG